MLIFGWEKSHIGEAVQFNAETGILSQPAIDLSGIEDVVPTRKTSMSKVGPAACAYVISRWNGN